MTEASRRGVTRGYVGGLIAAVAILGVALLIAVWGGIAYLTGTQPVATPGVWLMAAELIIAVTVGVLIWGLWAQAILLLRGRRTPPLGHTLVLAGGAYLIWCLGGMLFGLGVAETWLSPYAIALAAIWALCSLIFWAVLVRRVYTDRPVPQWPWERRGEPGPDWKTPEELRDLGDLGPDEARDPDDPDRSDPDADPRGGRR